MVQERINMEFFVYTDNIITLVTIFFQKKNFSLDSIQKIKLYKKRLDLYCLACSVSKHVLFL